MKRYMLDTDMCSYIIKQHPVSVLLHFQKLSMEQICISIISYAELMYGVERSSSKRINRPIIENFLRHLDVVEWGIAAADQYSVIRAELESKGNPIGAMDMLISAHAKSIKAVLVTNNQKHFTKVNGLKVENWA
ncbi:MAG: type II toxin-antitoxin system VapC family toxin [Gammaproteobacteria bacterium]|nr:type II toxin-antitoxin system VapC family toxin [Gammaproteobacteria bacterium]